MQPPARTEPSKPRPSLTGGNDPLAPGQVVTKNRGDVTPSTPSPDSAVGVPKRRRATSSYMSDEDLTSTVAPPEETVEWLCKVLSTKENAPLFLGLEPADMSDLVGRMRSVNVPAGKTLCTEGDPDAEVCYITHRGCFEQLVSSKDDLEFAFGIQSTEAKDKRLPMGKVSVQALVLCRATMLIGACVILRSALVVPHAGAPPQLLAPDPCGALAFPYPPLPLSLPSPSSPPVTNVLCLNTARGARRAVALRVAALWRGRAPL